MSRRVDVRSVISPEFGGDHCRPGGTGGRGTRRTLTGPCGPASKTQTRGRVAVSPLGGSRSG